jgi:ribosomal protein S6--L-glutamate ligase
MEIPIHENSELCGKALRDSGLRERDVLVLTIHRGSVAIPNPRQSREILAGDVLLCFGKNLTLKSLAPPKPARRKRKARPKMQPAEEPGA